MRKFVILLSLGLPTIASAQAYYPDVKTQLQNKIVEGFARGMEQGLTHSNSSPIVDQYLAEQRRQQWMRDQMDLEYYKSQLRRQEELNRSFIPRRRESINCYTIGPWTNCQ